MPLLPLAGPLFEGMEFPTGEVAKKVREPRLCHTKMTPSGFVVNANIPTSRFGVDLAIVAFAEDEAR